MEYQTLFTDNYRIAKTFGNLSLAAGENHFTRFEFSRLVEDNVINYAKPDVSKAGGITEVGHGRETKVGGLITFIYAKN